MDTGCLMVALMDLIEATIAFNKARDQATENGNYGFSYYAYDLVVAKEKAEKRYKEEFAKSVAAVLFPLFEKAGIDVAALCREEEG